MFNFSLQTSHTLFVIVMMISVWLMFMLSCVYVRQDYYLKIKKRKPKWMDQFPSLEKMHGWIVSLFYVSFVLLSVVVVNGIILAHYKWSADWLEQPKLLAAIITWFYFLIMLVVKFWKGLRGTKFFIWLIVGCLLLSLSMYGAYAWK